ncbi:unnamed protein product [Cylicostephanus goldi]|uniref:Uncharacterized protein n=1 Tax=Cylicostephanus goldi TaxID=71465 RepID=A0A3P7MU27_CYLGO|nr:unnamed protein product [Cylicostephanus goldi]
MRKSFISPVIFQIPFRYHCETARNIGRGWLPSPPALEVPEIPYRNPVSVVEEDDDDEDNRRRSLLAYLGRCKEIPFTFCCIS